jgi:acetoin utilization protein AcuB
MISPERMVREFMTPSPETVSPETALSDARDLMAEYQIRHLPVVRKGKVVGIVSARDVLVVEDIQVFAVYDTKVEEAMAMNPVCLPSETSIGHVVKTMATQNIGAVVIVDEGRLEGIFTDVDAVALLARLFEEA